MRRFDLITSPAASDETSVPDATVSSGHPDSRLFQRKQDLAAMVRVMSDQITEEHESSTVFLPFARFDETL